MKILRKLLLSACLLGLGGTALASPTQAAYPAPEITGIQKWLNSDPLTLDQLKGKVVLVDFWTYTCINCIHTLPYVKSWYDKYKDQGLVVIGVHTPEYPYERQTGNVQQALKRFDIRYPVAQDNDYATWDAYRNHYWPAEYLINKKGQVVYLHYGEGSYAQTEAAIRSLLAE
jgi:thiol-disulfide isomerase/thioredoxin